MIAHPDVTDEVGRLREELRLLKSKYRELEREVEKAWDRAEKWYRRLWYIKNKYEITDRGHEDILEEGGDIE